MIRLLLLLLLALSPFVSRANDAEGGYVSTGDVFEQLNDEKPLTAEQKRYFLAVAQSVSWLNYAAWSSQGRGIFCFADDVSISADQAVDIAKQALRDDPSRWYDERMSMASVVAVTLVNNHPCTAADVQEYQSNLFNAQSHIDEAIERAASGQ